MRCPRRRMSGSSVPSGSAATCWKTRTRDIGSARIRADAVDRIQAVAGVPGGMAAVEEFEARGGVFRELFVARDALFELGLQRRVRGEHFARDVFGDVGLHVLLGLEVIVEFTPGRQ